MISESYATQFRKVADACPTLMSITLPWSTSLFSIAAGVWLACMLLSLEVSEFRKDLKRLESIIPISLLLLGIVGTTWSPAPFAERLDATAQLVKLAAIPLLIYQFRRSNQAPKVCLAFLASCSILLLWSWLSWLYPQVAMISADRTPGVPVKNWIIQGQEFTLCIFGCLVSATLLHRKQRPVAAALMVLLAAAFLLNLAFVISSRTAIFTLPLLVLIFAIRLGRANKLILLLASLTTIGALWFASPYLRHRAESIRSEVTSYMETNEPTSAGQRIEFWRKSIGFIAESPILGNGTGSIEFLFQREAAGKTGAAAVVVANPHNQILNFGIQWGGIGILLLLAMWTIHFAQFVRRDPLLLLGSLIVAQNIIASMFNSHITDFAEGWLYVLGVGIFRGAWLGIQARKLS